MFTVRLEIIAKRPTAEKGGSENGNSPVRTVQLPHSCGGQEGELATSLSHKAGKQVRSLLAKHSLSTTRLRHWLIEGKEFRRKVRFQRYFQSVASSGELKGRE
jgi:hypothetical protein